MRKLLFAASLPLALCFMSGVRVNIEAAGARQARPAAQQVKSTARTAATIRTARKPASKTVALVQRGKKPRPAQTHFEPPRGAYLGASLSFENLAGSGTIRDKMASAMRTWETQAGRKHAIYLQFIPFPHTDGAFPAWNRDPKGWASSADFAAAVTTVGATPMITLEPQRPHDFALNWRAGSAAYEATRRYAVAVGQWKKPVFIRFAHEMNGSWYPWAEWIDRNRNQQRDPGEDTGFTASLYRTAFRNVALMFRRFAPNVALVWCPNSGLLGGPQRDTFGPWYPGDDVVDWVGIDAYERGWNMPGPGARPWGGQFAQTITHDAADDPNTPLDESINFYRTYARGKKKPMMIGETGATLSYRTDLPEATRAVLNNDWKTGYFNANEYGWMQSVYGTTAYTEHPLLNPLDTTFPQIKAIVWFQIAKTEDVPVQGPDGNVRWFDAAYVDYRIGGGVEKDGATPFATQELSLYRRLVDNSFFLSTVQR
jgi:hypothetical protein